MHGRCLTFGMVLGSAVLAGGLTSCAALTSWDGYVDGPRGPGTDGSFTDARPGLDGGLDTGNESQPGQDSTGVDSTLDSTITDAPQDSVLADTVMPGDSAVMADTSPIDSAPADTAVPVDSDTDTSTPDTSVADTSVADSSDSSVADSAEAAAGTFTVGGMISGLFAQDSLQLALNGSKQLLSPPQFTFAMPLADGSAYTVTVAVNPQMPIAETCTVTMGMGTIQGADVTNVAIKCLVNSYTIGGTVTGYSGTGLQLSDGTDTITIPASDAGMAAFVFPALASGDNYSVTVVASPGEYCNVTASGTIGASNVTNVQVSCVPIPACSPVCTDGVACVLSGDCASGVCSGTCQAPACAPGCAPGAPCGADGDCLSGTCTVPACM